MTRSALAAGAAGLSVALLVAGAARARAAAAVLGRRAPRVASARTPGPLARRGWGKRLGARLDRAGVPLGPGAFVGAVTALAAASAALAATALRLPLAAPAAAGAVVAGAAALVGSADRRRLTRVADGLPAVAQQLAAGLRAGLSLRQALARAARDAPEPVRAELERTVAELELGSRMEAALEDLAARVPVRDLRVMVTAILVQRRAGGNLARALATLAGRLEERGRLARELRGATAQARMTAWLVAALPLGGGLMAEIAAPGTLGGALGQGLGPVLLAAAGGLYAAGVALVRRIGRVEP